MTSIKNMRIGTRLGIGFAIVLGLQILIAGIALTRMADVSGKLDDITHASETKMRALLALRGGVYARAIAARNIAMVGEGTPQATELERVRAAKAAIDDAFRKLDEQAQSGGLDSDEKAFVQKAHELESKYEPIAGGIVELSLAQKRPEAIARLTNECMPLLTQVTDNLGQFLSGMQRENANKAAAAAATYQTSKWVLVALTLTSLAGGALLAWGLTASITRPIHTAVEVARTVAKGDLTSRIDTHTDDETGQLLRALEAMNTGLIDVVAQVRSSSDSIATGSNQIAAGNQDLSQRTEEQASNLQQTAASMEQLSGTVRNNADAAQQADQLAASASEVARKGGEVVGRVVSTMEQISASSKKIADIIGVIDGIAFQTNILALNAAVEAARAGEQGRGFAVVAGEVRNLAQRSAEAAKEIKSLIGESVEKVQTGSQLVDDAGRTMQDIVVQVKRVTDLIGEISSATREQTSGIEQVSGAVSQLDQVTQQNAALVEESAAAAESLRAQADALVRAVAIFNIGSDGASRAIERARASSRTEITDV